MNWLEIGGYYFNLDNIVFIKEDISKPDQTMFGFIGGQSLNVPLPKQTVVCMIIEHHKKLGLPNVPVNS